MATGVGSIFDIPGGTGVQNVAKTSTARTPVDGGITSAQQGDFLGSGGKLGPSSVMMPEVPAHLQVKRADPVVGGPLSSGRASGFQGGRPVSQASTFAEAERAFQNGNIGGAGGAANMNPAAPAPAPAAAPATAPASGSSTSPLNYYMERQLTGMAAPAAAQSLALGAGIQQQGQDVLAGQQQRAQLYNSRGANFNATGQNVAPRFNVGAQVPMGGGTAAPAALSTSQLGAAPSIGQIGNVAGQLGGAPQAAAVGNVAGRLGAAPQVGGVGNIQMGAGPGGVMPQLGNMGASSADQAGMMSRLNGFLDAPEGPSVAEAQLRQAQSNNMADLIGAARSGRGGAGAQAQALRGAMSEGSAIMSDTAGQLATLRAQEADMLKNRQLSAIGLGGDMATAARGQDLSFRGQDLQGLQGDQAAALTGRGQDLQAAMANQGTQTALEQLRANTALGARGQDLGALQGDQSTQAQMSLGQLQASLGARGQDLSALQGDQATALGREGLQAQTALGARGQDLSLLQGNQQTALGARGQDVTRELGLANVNLGMRGQDAGVLMGDADRNLAAQRLNLDAGLGYGGLANDATGMGLNYLSQANQQGVMSQGLSNDMVSNLMNNYTSMSNAETAGKYGVAVQNAANSGMPSFGESLAIAGMQGLGPGMGLLATALSDERAKTDISPLDAISEHLRGAPGYRYRYKPGVGEDPDVEHAGPMAQDLERGPFGKALVKQGADGFKRVDTNRLALVNHAGLAALRSELDRLKAQLEG